MNPDEIRQRREIALAHGEADADKDAPTLKCSAVYVGMLEQIVDLDVPALLDVLAVRDQELAIAQQRGDGWRDTVREDVEILRGLRDELRERAERLAVRDQQLEDARELLTVSYDHFVRIHASADWTEKLRAFLAGLDVQEAGQ